MTNGKTSRWQTHGGLLEALAAECRLHLGIVGYTIRIEIANGGIRDLRYIAIEDGSQRTQHEHDWKPHRSLMANLEQRAKHDNRIRTFEIDVRLHEDGSVKVRINTTKVLAVEQPKLPAGIR